MMTDDTPRMPDRIWADRSDDDLPQYADTPFGIWWIGQRNGYKEYVRADLHNAAVERAEKAEAEVVRLEQRLSFFDNLARDYALAALRQD